MAEGHEKDMTDGYVERRREYVANVRKSFDETSDSIEARGEETPKWEFFSFFKFRLLFAACLFAGFLYCHYTDTKIFDYSAKQMIELVSDNHYYTNLKNYVMIQERNASNAFSSEKREDIFE